MIYNPLDTFYKSQIGAIKEYSKITFRVKGNFNSCVFCIKKDGFEYKSYQMQKKENYFEVSTKLTSGLYFYYFDLKNGEYISNSYENIGVVARAIQDFQLTVYDIEYEVPSWLSGGIIYQIFPDRFYRYEKEKNVPSYKVLHKDWKEKPVFMPNEQGEILNNDFFGGDLKGITKKLDYIKSLGVNAIYLNPIFKAYSNHRYDTGDYMHVDELLGTESDLITLIDKAKEYGIKIVLDGVFNHTGIDSLYFNVYNRYDSLGASQSKDSKYYNWYNFNNFPNDYGCWWGIKTLPTINKENQDYIDFITGENGVIDHYTKLGVSGWRLDVVDELPSNFVKNIRKAVKKANKNAIIIGEVWEDASNKISYGKRREYFQGKELDSVMNYPLKNAIIEFVLSGNTNQLTHTICQQIDHYPQSVLHSLMNILSTHDTARILSVLCGENIDGKDKIELSKIKILPDKMKDAIFRLKVATLLQFTLCGVPSIYYGDEVGMEGFFDPLNRCPYPWGDENLEILEWYKFLSKLRKRLSAFKKGEFNSVYNDNGVLIYKRIDELSQVLICVNISQNTYDFKFNGNLKELISNKIYSNEYVLNKKTIAIFIKN